MRRHLLWLAVISVMTSATPAFGEAGQAAARRHYDEGQALFRAGAYEAALAEFRAANDIAPHPITIKSQGECLERLGRYEEAVRLFEEYLREAPSAPDAADIRARIQAHRSRGGRLRIYSNPAGAAVTLDGQRLSGFTPMEVNVSPGRHAVALELRDYQMGLEEFNVSQGGGYTVNIALVPLGGSQVATDPYSTTEPTTSDGDWRVSASVWAMIGVTGAALITGIVTGALALSDQGSFDDQIEQDGVTRANRLELEDIGDGGRIKALVADISYGVAGAAAATVLILFFVQNRNRGEQTSQGRHGSSLSLMPTMSGNGGGLSLGGSF